MYTKKRMILIAACTLSGLAFVSKMVSVDGGYFVPKLELNPFTAFFYQAPSMVQLMSGEVKGCAETGSQVKAINLADMQKIESASKTERPTMLGESFCKRPNGALIYKTVRDGIELEVNGNDIRLIRQEQRINGDPNQESRARTSGNGKAAKEAI